VALTALTTLGLALVACGGSGGHSGGEQAGPAAVKAHGTTTTTAARADSTTTPTTAPAAPTTTAAPTPPADDPLGLGDVDVSAANGKITISSPDGSVSMSQRDAVADLGGEVTDKGIKVALPDTVLFDFGSAALRRDARDKLSLIAGLAASYPGAAVTIGGHADSVGTATANQALSEDRADTVAAALSALGIDQDRMTATGFGETRPVAPNTNPDGSDNPEGRALNRRVEVLVVGADLR
jgi:outer membrane protein OmpA-like peptidoglycan-associated protein